MKRFFYSVVLAVFVIASLPGSPATAQSAQTLLERRVFYQFNPKWTHPKNVDERLKQHRFEGLILWVGQPKPGKPTILYLPGSGGNLALRRYKLPWFLDRGYGVVAMSYPGMGGSEGKPSHQRIQTLANKLYQRLPKYVGDSPTILWGESLGTGVALEIATHSVARKRPPLGIVLQAPYTSMVDLVAHKKPAMLPLFQSRSDLWPSKTTIKQTKAPLFILHGGKDDTVPVSMGRTLYKLSPSPNKVFVTDPEAGHTSIWRKDALAKMLDWIEALY
ncbi:alpha/beta hydrolase [Aliiroseovarius sediminis]|uniref:alpha/beta hydrolase n=1 Tax=Aliiroseovarius sediminis TaxID=2925839 RepID=UPI001F57FCFC|nr:alpha/beta hydrolase [Aliiroseovarius sediminis]MCI2394164.1 alpha/beta hydrolase [Aliiroseovarius sediminis]